MKISREDFFTYCENNGVKKSAKKYYDALKTCNEFMNFIETTNELIQIKNIKNLEEFLFYNEKDNYTNYGISEYSFDKLKVSYNKKEIKLICDKFENEFPIITNKVISKYSKSTINAAIAKINDIIKNNKHYISIEKSSISVGNSQRTELKEIETKLVSVRVIKRDPYVVEEALTKSNYHCEYDAKYKGFISNRNNEVYLEVHHLIPLKFYNEYPNLDIIENLVVLSPETHRLLHHGTRDDIHKVLRTLYDIKIFNLKKVGLDIAFEELFSLYFKDNEPEIMYLEANLYDILNER